MRCSPEQLLKAHPLPAAVWLHGDNAALRHDCAACWRDTLQASGLHPTHVHLTSSEHARLLCQSLQQPDLFASQQAWWIHVSDPKLLDAVAEPDWRVPDGVFLLWESARYVGKTQRQRPGWRCFGASATEVSTFAFTPSTWHSWLVARAAFMGLSLTSDALQALSEGHDVACVCNTLQLMRLCAPQALWDAQALKDWHAPAHDPHVWAFWEAWLADQVRWRTLWAHLPRQNETLLSLLHAMHALLPHVTAWRAARSPQERQAALKAYSPWSAPQARVPHAAQRMKPPLAAWLQALAHWEASIKQGEGQKVWHAVGLCLEGGVPCV